MTFVLSLRRKSVLRESYGFAALAFSLLLSSCGHPLEIAGEGDIWSMAGRICTFESHAAGRVQCRGNHVIDDYRETYYATPREGWRFDRWSNYCTDTSANQCRFDVSAAVVKRFYGKVMPPLRAVFVPDAAPPTLAAAAQDAGLHVGVAIDHGMALERRALVQREFTSATPENALKWHSLAPAPGSYDFSGADATVSLAVEAGLRIRGHTLFWHRLNGLPVWLMGELDGASDPARRLRELMEEHAAVTVGRYAGLVQQWDVVNEPLALVSGDLDADNVFYQLLGEQYLDLAFGSAHAADPSAELFLNETFTEFSPAKFDALVALVSRLRDRGVPIHGVGLQGHFFLQSPDGDLLQRQLERITALGLRVELTEVDVPLPLFASREDPLQYQAIAFGTVFSACLAVPGCTGVTLWGLDDGDTWLDGFFLTAGNAPNRPLLFDEQLAPKPAYYLVRGLLDGH